MTTNDITTQLKTDIEAYLKPIYEPMTLQFKELSFQPDHMARVDFSLLSEKWKLLLHFIGTVNYVNNQFSHHWIIVQLQRLAFPPEADGR